MSSELSRLDQLKKSLAAQRLAISKTLSSVEKVETTLKRSLLATQLASKKLDDKLKLALAADIIDSTIDVDEDDEISLITTTTSTSTSTSTAASAIIPVAPTVILNVLVPPSPPTTRVSIAMLIREPPIKSLHTFIKYHFSIGINKLYLYFDDIANQKKDHILMKNILKTFNNDDEKVIVVDCSAKWYYNTKKTSALWKEYGQYIETDLIARQVIAVEQAILRATLDGMDWLVHIDVDELLYWNNNDETTFNNICTWFDQIPSYVDSVRFLNVEGAPESIEFTPPSSKKEKEYEDQEDDYFQHISLFKRNPLNVSMKSMRQWPKNKIHFTAYHNGKSAVRCRENVVPFGSHKFCYQNSNNSSSSNCSLLSLDAKDVQLYHYPHASFTQWWKKYRILGTFPNYHLGIYEIPNNCFHLQSRDAICGHLNTGDNSEGEEQKENGSSDYRERYARELYKRHCVYEDENEKIKLIQSGLLIRNNSISRYIETLL